jgi:hypothetical protein
MLFAGVVVLGWSTTGERDAGVLVSTFGRVVDVSFDRLEGGWSSGRGLASDAFASATFDCFAPADVEMGVVVPAEGS